MELKKHLMTQKWDFHCVHQAMKKQLSIKMSFLLFECTAFICARWMMSLLFLLLESHNADLNAKITIEASKISVYKLISTNATYLNLITCQNTMFFILFF